MTGLTLRNRSVTSNRAIDEILTAVATRVVPVGDGEQLYRARLLPPHYGYKSPVVYDATEMWQPPIQHATGGRLNPSGIPYLYMAREEPTAVAEVQPWKSAYITLAAFRTQTAFNIIDLATPSVEHSDDNYVIKMLGSIFSEPAHRHDPTAYAATQFLSELLKARAPNDCRGVQYPSALHVGGVNLALFGWGRDVEFEQLVECQATTLIRVGRVEYSYSPEESPAE